jgi:hypothetical protein
MKTRLINSNVFFQFQNQRNVILYTFKYSFICLDNAQPLEKGHKSDGATFSMPNTEGPL